MRERVFPRLFCGCMVDRLVSTSPVTIFTLHLTCWHDSYNEPWWVTCPTCHYNHYTSRECTVQGCKGKLKDTIVNFGDMLHDRVLGGLPRAESECRQADICLCLGSSLTVSPANSLPRKAKEIVICNPQVTELDSKAALRVWATSDMFFAFLQEALLEKGIVMTTE